MRIGAAPRSAQLFVRRRNGFDEKGFLSDELKLTGAISSSTITGPGEHVLALRQPDIGYAGEKKVTVTGGETTRIEIELSAKDVRTR
jgi:hypothetical protein